MTVLLAILPILAVLIPFIINAITKYQSNAEDRKTINQKAYDTIDKQIASGSSDAITLGGNSDLDELDRLQRSARGDSQR